MKNHAKRKGDLEREFACPFCGQAHRRRSKEARECRRRARSGQKPLPTADPPQPAPPPRKGSEVTHYVNDPLGGDQNAHTIARKLRRGYPPRKIAKQMGLPLDEIKNIAERIGVR